MLRKKINSIIKITVLTSLVVSTMMGSTLALETKPDPENYEKTTQYIEEVLEIVQESIIDAKDTLENKDQWSEISIGSAEATLESNTSIIQQLKTELFNNPKRIAFNEKYNLPSYVSTVYNDDNKHNVDKKQLQDNLKIRYKSSRDKSKLNYLVLESIVRQASVANPKNISIVTNENIVSIGIYGHKFNDSLKFATLKDVIIKLSEIYGTNNDCMEKILSYNDKVKYPELKDIPNYERRFINFAFDNKLYPRTKQVNLNSHITEKQAYDLVIAMILK